jgi:trans-2,3-dihydro-3-hydroxyanthranilate isomerase
VRVPFRLVDVFAEAPFEGNQLCVVAEPLEGLDGGTMQRLALEIGFSETTFVTAVRRDGYDVRIFTPDAELPFAGHPTIGTAFVLANQGSIATEAIQRCGAGDIPVHVDLAAGRASMRQLPPVFGPELKDRAAVAAAAGLSAADLVDDLPIVAVSTGIAHLMVPVVSEEALRRATRRAETGVVTVESEAESLYLFVVRGGGDVMARMFDRGESIGEDPATGSAAGPLGAYLSEQGLAGMPGRLVISQGELTGRPSHLVVDVSRGGKAWTVDVEGGVFPMAEGVFEIS